MEADLGTILWALSQSDLRIEWELDKEAISDGALAESPDRAYFRWKRGGAVVWGTCMLDHELQECIDELARQDVEIPPEFVQAREIFRKSGRSDNERGKC